MLIGNQFGQVRSTCHCLRKSNNSSVFSGKNAGKFSMRLTRVFWKRLRGINSRLHKKIKTTFKVIIICLTSNVINERKFVKNIYFRKVGFLSNHVNWENDGVDIQISFFTYETRER